jgi:hypothetical protein
MKKLLLIIVFFGLLSVSVYAQTNQQKAQELVTNHFPNSSIQSINFGQLVALRSSYADTKIYKNYLRKIDSLKLEGRKIDARIPKLKTTSEINLAKKDSKSLSNQLVSTSNRLIDFMTEYKGQQTGWIMKTSYGNKTTRKKRYFLDQELTKVDSVR